MIGEQLAAVMRAQRMRVAVYDTEWRGWWRRTRPDT